MTRPPRVAPVTRVALVACAVLAVFVVATTALGMVRWYSPVPYYDMWDGGVEFYGRVAAGYTSAWWKPHNEHRVVATRLLLWMDAAWLHAADVAPRIVDALAIAMAAWILWRLSIVQRDDGRRAARDLALGLFLLAWLGSWMQKENLTSGFQSCFVLAQVVPLAAFATLARASRRPSSTARFVGACVLGIASAGTMINGLLALPLMTLQAAASGATRRRIVALSMLSIVVPVVYLHGYDVATMADTTASRGTPAVFAQYLLDALGGPFHPLLKQGVVGRTGALVTGAVLLSGWAVAIVGAWRAPVRSAARVAVIVFIGYVVVAAMLTAWGRMRFGADQAFAGRYATPALMAWAALFVLCAPRIGPAMRGRRTFVVGVVCVGLLMVRMQGEAVRSSPDATRFAQEVAALALALQVDDPATIRAVYPDVPRVLRIAASARDRHPSVFDRFPWRDVGTEAGRPFAGDVPSACAGVVERRVALADEARFQRVEGRLDDPTDAPGRLRLVDATGRIVGFATSAAATSSRDEAPRARVVRGYVLADAAPPMRMVGEAPPCTGRTVLPTDDAR